MALHVMDEANRCLGCKVPQCRKGCPIDTPIPEVIRLLKEKKLLVVQGSGFNWGRPDHFRIVYLPRIEVLKDAVGKIGDFLSYYRQ